MATSVRFFSTPDRCEYLPDRLSRLEYDIAPHVTPDEYLERLRQGWRRFSHAMFRPACQACTMCQSLRVPVASFQPTRSQRRAWNVNRRDVSLVVGTPVISPEREALFERFHAHGHETKGWPAHAGHGLELFVDNPFPTEEWCYYSGSRLIGVGYVDALREGLSAIYFYYDPDEAHRSPGTFNVLALLAAARERCLPHVYLGYFVAGCRSLEYKARFGPHEILRPDGSWTP